MSLLKKALILVVVAYVFDSILVYAVGQSSYLTFNIGVGQQVSTDYKTKTTDSFTPQSYTNTFTNTTLTSPCPSCVIAVKFESSNGDYVEQVARMNETATCKVTALWAPGRYRLKLRRSDPTALSTYTSGRWDY